MRSFSATNLSRRASTPGSEPQALDGDGAAVDAAQDPVPLEDGQVPTNRLGRDVEDLGKSVDLDSSLGAGAVEDELLAFLCVHGHLSAGIGW